MVDIYQYTVELYLHILLSSLPTELLVTIYGLL